MENNMVFMEKFREKKEAQNITARKKITNTICAYVLIRELLKTSIKQTFGFKNKEFFFTKISQCS